MRTSDAEGAIVGLDIDGASKKLDLAMTETVEAPVRPLGLLQTLFGRRRETTLPVNER